MTISLWPLLPSVVNAFAGTARYKGDAAGKYVIDDQVNTARIGIFTADAELEIDFGLATNC